MEKTSDEYRVVNRQAVCKATDADGNMLYKDAAYTVPAVYDALNSDVLNGTTLYASGNPSPYSGGYCIKMLIPEYTLSAALTLNTGKTVTLTTAGKTDGQYPYTGGTGVATITRGFDNSSMIASSGTLTVKDITLDGGKGSGTTPEHSTTANGGIVNVAAGSLTVESGATLQNSVATSTGNGGALYVANGATMTMTGGSITGNSATNGGAVGVGGADSRLYFGGDASVTGNTGGVSGTEARNVFLDQDSKQIIQTKSASPLTEAAVIGVYCRIPRSKGPATELRRIHMRRCTTGTA